MNDSLLTVRCYSGHTYAQRPVSFRVGESEYRVLSIQKTWREPGRVSFTVTTEEGPAFTLEYDEASDTWRLAGGG